jgi:hypothetical protein
MSLLAFNHMASRNVLAPKADRSMYSSNTPQRKVIASQFVAFVILNCACLLTDPVKMILGAEDDEHFSSIDYVMGLCVWVSMLRLMGNLSTIQNFAGSKTALHFCQVWRGPETLWAVLCVSCSTLPLSNSFCFGHWITECALRAVQPTCMCSVPPWSLSCVGVLIALPKTESSMHMQQHTHANIHDSLPICNSRVAVEINVTVTVTFTLTVTGNQHLI